MVTRTISIKKPRCQGMEELLSAEVERARVLTILNQQAYAPTYIEDAPKPNTLSNDPLFTHLSYGLAYTVGSALGSIPPTTEACLAAFSVPNVAGLGAGARAWSKHFHRSMPAPTSPSNPIPDDLTESMSPTFTPATDGAPAEKPKKKKNREPPPPGWWGRPSGSVATINEKALLLFWKIMNNATWRNLHWLPHQVLVYEVRVEEGYGLRWSQDRTKLGDEVPLQTQECTQENTDHKTRALEEPPWIFRGFVEPMMENGHGQGWRH